MFKCVKHDKLLKKYNRLYNWAFDDYADAIAHDDDETIKYYADEYVRVGRTLERLQRL